MTSRPCLDWTLALASAVSTLWGLLSTFSFSFFLLSFFFLSSFFLLSFFFLSSFFLSFFLFHSFFILFFLRFILSPLFLPFFSSFHSVTPPSMDIVTSRIPHAPWISLIHMLSYISSHLKYHIPRRTNERTNERTIIGHSPFPATPPPLL
ncbi:hypothetical protein BDV93DRAFT_83158 [Ceratobasidium sp. AG-I]|nr:hypothetical protein BDV93DRAFT_83158 [Ceratobasidium sp. AG-I]